MARKRWFVLHLESRVLAYYTKSFIPPARSPLKGKIHLSDIISVDRAGARIEITVRSGQCIRLRLVKGRWHAAAACLLG